MRYNTNFVPQYENTVLTLKNKDNKVTGYVIEWDGKTRFYQGSDGLVTRAKDNSTPFEFYKDAEKVLEASEKAHKEYNKSH